MTRPVVAIGLDGADPVALEPLLDAGQLPNLARLRAEGAWGRVVGPPHHRAETPWTTFLTGLNPQTLGFWGSSELEPGSYRVRDPGAYDFAAHPPFYARAEGRRIAVLDLPRTRLRDDLDGVQVVAWGAHAPGGASGARPAGLWDAILRDVGPHPALHRDDGEWWRPRYLRWLRRSLHTGIERRTRIARELLSRERFDLFLMAFGETHPAGHDFWLQHAPYPVSAAPEAVPAGDLADGVVAIYAAVDAALGALREVAPDDALWLVFSPHGMDANATDVPSMALLGELLYRDSFPGRALLPREEGPLPPPLAQGLARTWTEEVWRLREDPVRWRRWLRRRLPIRAHPAVNALFGSPHPPDWRSPSQLRADGDPYYWEPVSWYRPFWPGMRAFALPSFSEGYVRINLRGREPEGRVAAQDYGRVCDELEALLRGLVDPRSGEPAVRDVVRTRARSLDDPAAPPADLVVLWRDAPTDVVEHPALGRVGPLPFKRSGGHRSRGFACLAGPGVPAGTRLPEAAIVDLAPTLLDALGEKPPPELEGHSLLPALRGGR